MASYQLGAVTPFVERVAYILGPMFGITTVYGYRSQGSIPDSDHPKGKALDFMVSNTAAGNALANFATLNAKALGIKYIVWNRKSWNPSRKTWEPYTTTDNPHTDHVHISFNDTNDGTPLSEFANGFGSGVTAGVDALRKFGPEDALGLVDPLGISWFSQLLKPEFGRRVATGLMGVGLIITGLVFLARRPIGAIIGGVGGTLGDIAGTAVQGWAFGLGAGATGGIGGKGKPVSSAPSTTPSRPGPRPPAIEAPSNAPTTSVLPPEVYAPVSPGGTYQVTTAVGRAPNPTQYQRPKGKNLLNLSTPGTPKSRKKGTASPGVSAPLRQTPTQKPKPFTSSTTEQMMKDLKAMPPVRRERSEDD